MFFLPLTFNFPVGGVPIRIPGKTSVVRKSHVYLTNKYEGKKMKLKSVHDSWDGAGPLEAFVVKMCFESGVKKIEVMMTGNTRL